MRAKRNFFEKFSNAATIFTGSSYAFLEVLAIVINWAVTGPVFKYSETWLLVINTIYAASKNQDEKSEYFQNKK